MKFFDKHRRERLDRIKNRIRKDTARYYLKKIKNETAIMQDNFKIELRNEKKSMTDYYESRIESLNEKIDLLESDVRFYKKQWDEYIILKNELEKAAGIIDIKDLQNQANRIFALLYSAIDKVNMVEIKHDKKGLVGIK